jgi:hypothetical protein
MVFKNGRQCYAFSFYFAAFSNKNISDYSGAISATYSGPFGASDSGAISATL